MKKLTREHWRLFADRGAEAGREMALLWLVFSALDALIGGRLTLLWLTMNIVGSVVVWTTSIYLEIFAKEMTT
ncbi:MAG: hypothetical protein ACRD3J_12885 [Thermoanaerobaculia bacterium]